MNVIFVNRGMGFFRGGGENVDLNLARSLGSLGVRIRFMTGRALFGGIRCPVKEFGTTYVRTPYLRDFGQRLHRGGGRVMHADRRMFASACIRRLRTMQHVDVVQVCSIPEMVALKKYRRLPVVIRFPGPPWAGDFDLAMQADRVIANGDALVRIRKEFRQDAVDIPVGVDSRLFSVCDASAIQQQHGLKRGLTMIFTGRLVPIKRIEFLIEAIVGMPREVRLLIVGEGPMEGFLRARAAAAGVAERVVFAGAVPQADLARYYSAGDVFVLSSEYDNFPNAVLEAMACGLPVIGPRVGGVPMQVEDGVTGFLYEPGDAAGFRERVRTLLDDAGLRAAMGRAGRKTAVRRFSWEESARKLLGIYEELV